MKRYSYFLLSLLLLIASGKALYAEHKEGDKDFHYRPVPNDQKEHHHGEAHHHQHHN